MSAPGPTDDERVRRARTRWLGLAVGSVVLFAVVYVTAVLTPGGQSFEDAALSGALQARPEAVEDADLTLNTITVTTLAIWVAVLGTVGLVRGGIRMGVVVAGIVVVGLGVAELLKRYVLVRPDLLGEAAHNSFPSGHTTIAMTLVVATLVVTPWRWRTPAMLVVMTLFVGFGSLTITARWHRLSDTLGGDLIALTWGSVAAVVLLRMNAVRVAAGRPRRLRVVVVAGAAALALLAIVAGTIIAIAYAGQGPGSGTPVDIREWNAYLAAQAYAGAASLLAVLIAWGSWHRLETVRPNTLRPNTLRPNTVRSASARADQSQQAPS